MKLEQYNNNKELYSVITNSSEIWERLAMSFISKYIIKAKDIRSIRCANSHNATIITVYYSNGYINKFMWSI